MSQRVLIVGVSESGKTELAKRLIKESSIPVFIRDPIGASWPRMTARFETSDELRLLLDAQKKAPCIVVIDEAADFFAVGQRENHWIFTRGRHDAMLPIAIGQRIKMMAPNIREQATDLYVFESSIEAGEILAEAYNMAGLENAHTLRQGEFFHVRREAGVRVLTEHKLW